MIRSLTVSTLLLPALPVLAQMTPLGVWHTIDDADGKPAAEVRISEESGVLKGVVEKSLKPGVEPNCDRCTDDRKGKPKLGMEIIRGARKADGKDVWEGGNILDPNNGTVYRLRMTPIEGGRKLEVRGFVGVALLGRTQTWVRVQ
ncbi:MAG: DUF2147 domain-containing protein [Rhodoferax sp.]|nr:DUF2147 domain-containing protein [Rhodoferax sp.]